MATASSDDIARLRAVIADCCQTLSALTDEQFVRSLEGEVPTERTGTSQALLKSDETYLTPEEIAAGDSGPRWQPLLVGLPPGIEQLVGMIKPPLEVFVAVLQIIATFLQILAAILLGIADPLRALIMAAYEAIRNIINDIINSGAYMYFDAPGITSPMPSESELGFSLDVKKTFEAGRNSKQIPQFVPSGWEKWSARFKASFDDPGDLQRPTLSDGAAVQALFIMVACPSMELLRQFLYVLGALFNVQPFVRAWEKFQQGPAPLRQRVRGRSVPPDWKSVTLKSLFPEAMRKLAKIPEQLLGLLRQVDNLVGLIQNVANAIAAKAQLLQELAAIIQAILDLLEALSSAGMWYLQVGTMEGPAGLKSTFDSAANRPPGDYVGGICLMLGGPGISDGAFLWDMLVGNVENPGESAGAYQMLKDAWWGNEDSLFPKAGAILKQEGAELEKTANEKWDEAKKAADAWPQATLDALGKEATDIGEAFYMSPAEFEEWTKEYVKANWEDPIAKAHERSVALRRKSDRSLTAYLGRPGVAGPPPPKASIDDEDLP